MTRQELKEYIREVLDEVMNQENDQVTERAKWRSSSAAVHHTPDADYEWENPRSTGPITSKADTPAHTGSLSRRTPGQIATTGPNKGKLTKKSAETLKGRIRAARVDNTHATGFSKMSKTADTLKEYIREVLDEVLDTPDAKASYLGKANKSLRNDLEDKAFAHYKDGGAGNAGSPERIRAVRKYSKRADAIDRVTTSTKKPGETWRNTRGKTMTRDKDGTVRDTSAPKPTLGSKIKGLFGKKTENSIRLKEMLNQIVNEKKNNDPRGVAFKAGINEPNDYGPPTPFGQDATRNSLARGMTAARALRRAGKDPNDPKHSDELSFAVHQGWSKAAQNSPHQSPEQKARRAKLIQPSLDAFKTNLSPEERAKDVPFAQKAVRAASRTGEFADETQSEGTTKETNKDKMWDVMHDAGAKGRKSGEFGADLVRKGRKKAAAGKMKNPTGNITAALQKQDKLAK